MADLISAGGSDSPGGSNPISGAERQTLRYWPWLVLCVLAAIIFGGLTAVGVAILTSVDSVPGYLVAGLVTAGFALLAVYSLASLRTRTLLDPTGLTAIGAFSRRRTTPWSAIERLDVTHSLPGWAIRAWTRDGDSVVVYMCHDTHGKRPKEARTFEQPPREAPAGLHRGFLEIERYRKRFPHGG